VRSGSKSVSNRQTTRRGVNEEAAERMRGLAAMDGRDRLRRRPGRPRQDAEVWRASLLPGTIQKKIAFGRSFFL